MPAYFLQVALPITQCDSGAGAQQTSGVGLGKLVSGLTSVGRRDSIVDALNH